MSAVRFHVQIMVHIYLLSIVRKVSIVVVSTVADTLANILL